MFRKSSFFYYFSFIFFILNIELIWAQNLNQQDVNVNQQSTTRDFANNPLLSLTADMIGNWGIKSNKASEVKEEIGSPVSSISTNNFYVRSLELAISGDVDQWMRGVAIIAFHRERGGGNHIDVHEAYLDFIQLPANLRLKLGKFFIDAGRLNSIHQHDWSFTTTPVVHYEFFDLEGVADYGGELSYLMPYNFYQEIKFGLYNGEGYGEKNPTQNLDPSGLNSPAPVEGAPPIDDGHNHITEIFSAAATDTTSSTVTATTTSTTPYRGKKPSPMILGRLKNFIPINYQTGTSFGFTYLRYNLDDNPKNFWQLGGFDFILKKENGKISNLEWGNEFWGRKQESATNEPEIKYGFYTYINYHFNFIWNIGVRFDEFFQENYYQRVTNEYVFRRDTSQSIWIGLKPSEFSNFKLTFEHQKFFNQNDNYIVYLQALFIIGFHPAHSY